MQDNIYLEQFEPHAAEFAHKTHNKMKAKELDYIFEGLIASLCENRNPVVRPSYGSCKCTLCVVR